MKKALLFVLALAVIPVAVDAQNPSADYWRPRAEAGDANAQTNLGLMYANGEGVPEDYGVVRMEVDYEESPPTPQASIGGSCTIWLSNSTTSAGQYW